MQEKICWIQISSLLIEEKWNFGEGSDGEVDRASDFHFNVSGFKPRFGHRNFSSRFHHFYNFGTIRTLIWWKHFPLSSVKNNWLAQFPCFHHEMPVCECEWVCIKDVCSWGLFRPEHSGGICVGCVPFPSNYASLPCMQGPWCDMSVNVKTDRGFIGSSGNVGVYR